MTIYDLARKWKDKYPFTIAWRIRRHSQIVQKHINPDEKVMYVFCAQKNDNPIDVVSSAVIVLTNKRLLVGQKRVLFGYFFTSITPDLFNDLEVKAGLIWGKVYIDTIKELVVLSNIALPALVEIETKVTTIMMHEKKKYGKRKQAPKE